MASTIVVDKIQKTGGEAIQWPAADGAANTVLRTTGSGVLEFAADATELLLDTSPQLGADLDCNGSQIQWSKGADVASATALVLLTDGNYFDVTGTVTITSFNTTGGPGTQIKLHFIAACTLTHHASDLKLPGGANILTAAGDTAEFIEYAAGDYICTSYTKASGKAVVESVALTEDQNWSGSQRGTPSIVTDGTLDLNTANNFQYTPAASPDTLEFSNETIGQTGFIQVINASGHTIALGSEVRKGASWDVSTAGTYLVTYYCDGTLVWLSASEALVA